MDLDTFDKHFPGALSYSELCKQILKHGSTIGHCLHKMMALNESMPAHTAREMITIILIMRESRKATKAQITERARNLSYLRRMFAEGTAEERKDVKDLLSDMAEVLDNAPSTFEVKFPPDGYAELRAEPRLSARKQNTDIWHAWRDKVGAEMAEDEKDEQGELHYNYGYESSKGDTYSLFHW
jgi:hypothetical protein